MSGRCAVSVAVCVAVSVAMCVAVSVAVCVAVSVAVSVALSVAVSVAVIVAVSVAVCVAVSVAVPYAFHETFDIRCKRVNHDIALSTRDCLCVNPQHTSTFTLRQSVKHSK